MRVKGGVKGRRRHKRVLKLAEGIRGRRSSCFRLAKLGVQKALRYAYRDRHAFKRQERMLWIARINAALRELGVTYSVFVAHSKKAGLAMDRKVLAELAVNEPSTFKAIVARVQAA